MNLLRLSEALRYPTEAPKPFKVQPKCHWGIWAGMTPASPKFSASWRYPWTCPIHFCKTTGARPVQCVQGHSTTLSSYRSGMPAHERNTQIIYRQIESFLWFVCYPGNEHQTFGNDFVMQKRLGSDIFTYRPLAITNHYDALARQLFTIHALWLNI